MKIEKTESGAYRVRPYINGKRKCLTFDHRPTQKEIADKVNELSNTSPLRGCTSVREACKQYTEMRKNVVSPRTYLEYTRMPDRLPSWFTDLNAYEVTTADFQQMVNELTASHNPKTVICLYHFARGSVALIRPEFNISVTLPQKVAPEAYIPTDEEVKKLMAYTKEHAPHFYVAMMLGCWGLRRSEIIGVKATDLDGNMLHIQRAVVETTDKNWVEKTTKTEKSDRYIVIPDDVADLIREKGVAYDCAPQSISNYMRRTQELLGMPNFSLHKLRHYFASKLMTMGYDSKTIQEAGGWSSDNVMKTVYQHAMRLKTQNEKQLLSNALLSDISS